MTSLTLEDALKKAHKMIVSEMGNYPEFFKACQFLKGLYDANEDEFATTMVAALGDKESKNFIEIMKNNLKKGQNVL